jgi:hypothetical protein
VTDQQDEQTQPKPDMDPATEVAQRSPDGSSGLTHYKQFLVAASGTPGDDDDPWHDANKRAVLQEAIQRGLRPKGDVKFVSAEEQTDGLLLTYEVTTDPADQNPDPPSATTTPSRPASKAAEPSKPVAKKAAVASRTKPGGD